MKTYISLLRGINVSGQKPVKMPDLKKMFENLGYLNVQTYIQSGNVIFSSNSDLPVKELAIKIETSIREKFKFDVPVFIKSEDELQAIIEANPYRNSDGSLTEKIYITFLEINPDEALVEKINILNFLPDRFAIKGREVFIDCASGYGTTKLSNTFFENRLKVKATTRNWKTVNTLLQMATNIQTQSGSPSSNADRSY